MKDATNTANANTRQIRKDMSRKIRKSKERFEESCGWLASLEEGIRGFEEAIAGVNDQLDTLRNQTKNSHRLDGMKLREINGSEKVGSL